MSYKSRQREKLLEHDDSAFLYFASSILGLILLPVLYNFVVYGLLGKFREKEFPLNSPDCSIKKCGCSVCQERMRNKQISSRTTILGRFKSRIIQIIFIAILSFFLYENCMEILQSPISKTPFDPYELLELPYGSTDKEVKTAFRKLSVKYHPDKNINDPQASNRYIKITKAYEALTNEVAKKNWEKYGNPDGPQPLKFAIGLPRMLLQTEYSVIVLSAFLVVILVIPLFFYFWLKKTQKVDRNGLALDNYRYISESLSKDLKYSDLLSILVSLPEFDSISIDQDLEVLQSLSEKLSKHLPNIKDLDENSRSVIILFTAYMYREPLTPYLTTHLVSILSKSYKLIEAFIEIGMQFNLLTGGQKVGLKSEMIWVDLMQALSQGVSLEDSSYMMLPHITPQILKECKINAGKQKIEFNRDRLRGKLDEHKLADIEEAARRISDLDITVKVFVEGEENILEGDVLTVQLTVTRKNLQPKEETGFIHSTSLPFLKYEKIYVFLGDCASDSIYSIFKLTAPSQVQTTSIKFGISRPPFSLSEGSYTWQAILKSDSYLIPDLVISIPLTVQPIPDSKSEEDQHSESSENVPDLSD